MKIPTGGQFENPPAGSHIARCISVIDLGTQQHQGFQGSPPWSSRDVRITFELPTTMMEGIYKPEVKGKPFGASITLKQSLHPSSKMRKMLVGWRGRDFTAEELGNFDLKSILGKACFLSLVERGEYVNIESIAAIPKGVICPPQVNPSIYFSLDPSEFDNNVLTKFGDKLQEKIQSSPEYQALFSGTQQPDQPDMPEDQDSDSPF
jgi:hypothetical protein